MIAGLKGVVEHKDADHLILNVGGVGYRVYVQTDTASKATRGEELSLFTHLAVRETSMDLYGFPDKESLDLFELLIGISGIGPKSALSVLSVAPVETLTQAISTGEMGYLTKVSGIGKKMAEKIMLELKDKLAVIETPGTLKDATDALAALMALGYGQREAREALKEVPESVTGVNDKIKAALKILG